MCPTSPGLHALRSEREIEMLSFAAGTVILSIFVIAAQTKPNPVPTYMPKETRKSV